LIGVIGNAFKYEEAPRYTTLTPDEQYSYMSMWSLMASPLFFSGDITRLDAFTKNVLCNAEVIDVNQDILGKQARVVRHTPEELILAKPLEDGSVAVGLFNLTKASRRIAADFSDLGLSGKRSVRDLWRQKSLPATSLLIAAEVNAHGVVLLKLD
jgi:alpha-galactosidase